MYIFNDIPCTYEYLITYAELNYGSGTEYANSHGWQNKCSNKSVQVPFGSPNKGTGVTFAPTSGSHSPLPQLGSHSPPPQLPFYFPVVPHKAVAEVSKMKTYRRGELVWRKSGRANPLMDRKVLEVSHSCSLFLWLSTYLPIYLLCIYLSIDLSLSLSLSLSSNYLSIYLSIFLSIYLSVECSCSCSVVECSVV